jgi:hypothetical protein
MGVAKDLLIEFINGIDKSDLTSFPPRTGSICWDDNYRLDNQGVRPRDCGCGELLLNSGKSEKYDPKRATRNI